MELANQWDVTIVVTIAITFYMAKDNTWFEQNIEKKNESNEKHFYILPWYRQRKKCLPNIYHIYLFPNPRNNWILCSITKEWPLPYMAKLWLS